MKINLTQDLDAVRARVKAAVDEWFNREALSRTHLDQAHRRKREEAKIVDAVGLSDHTPMLSAEAAQSGRDAKELAREILEKPDAFEQREILRRKIVEDIRAAGTAEDIYGVPAKHDVHLQGV